MGPKAKGASQHGLSAHATDTAAVEIEALQLDSALHLEEQHRSLVQRAAQIGWSNPWTHLGDGPEDGGVYLVPGANDCTCRPRADAVLAVLPVHAQPIQRMGAQQAQRVHYRYADVCTHGATLVRPRTMWLSGQESTMV